MTVLENWFSAEHILSLLAWALSLRAPQLSDSHVENLSLSETRLRAGAREEGERERERERERGLGVRAGLRTVRLVGGEDLPPCNDSSSGPITD